jgi:hypothetical protein
VLPFKLRLVAPLLLCLGPLARAQNPAVTIPDTNVVRVTAALTEEFGAQGFTLLSTTKQRITFQRDQGQVFIRGQQFPMRLEVILLVERRADSLRLISRRDLVARLSTGIEERRRMEPRQRTAGLQELLDRVRARYTDAVEHQKAKADSLEAEPGSGRS